MTQEEEKRLEEIERKKREGAKAAARNQQAAQAPKNTVSTIEKSQKVSTGTPISASSMEAERQQNTAKENVLAQRRTERQQQSIKPIMVDNIESTEMAKAREQEARIAARDKEEAAKIQQNALKAQQEERAAEIVKNANMGALGKNAGAWAEYKTDLKYAAKVDEAQKAYAEKYKGFSAQAAGAEERSEQMAADYYAAKDFIENAKFDSTLDNAAFKVVSDWVTATGKMASNAGKNVGEILKDDTHDEVYVTPAMAQQTARGNTVARALGVETEELTPFSTLEEIPKADTAFNRAMWDFGDRIITAYSGNDPNGLNLEKAVTNADLAYQTAKANAKTPLESFAVDGVNVVNDMLITYAMSMATGGTLGISDIYAIRTGNETMQEMLEEGYETKEAFLGGLAFAGMGKMVESGFGFGKETGNIIENTAKKLGNEAVKFLGKNVPGKTVATTIQVASGLLSKPILGRVLKGSTDALGEGFEEGLEYCLEYALSSLFKRPDVSFEIKEMLYSMGLGVVGGAVFGGSNAAIDYIADPMKGHQYYHARQTLEAEKMIDYLNELDPDIVAKAVEGDLDGMESLMKGLDYELLNENGQRVVRETEILRKFQENIKPEDYAAVKDIEKNGLSAKEAVGFLGKVREFIHKVHNKETVTEKEGVLWKVPVELGEKFEEARKEAYQQANAEIDENISPLAGRDFVLEEGLVTHGFNRHGNEKIETSRDQVALNEENMAMITRTISAPDVIEMGLLKGNGEDKVDSFLLVKHMEGSQIVIIDVGGERWNPDKMFIHAVWQFTPHKWAQYEKSGKTLAGFLYPGGRKKVSPERMYKNRDNQATPASGSVPIEGNLPDQQSKLTGLSNSISTDSISHADRKINTVGENNFEQGENAEATLPVGEGDDVFGRTTGKDAQFFRPEDIARTTKTVDPKNIKSVADLASYTTENVYNVVKAVQKAEEDARATREAEAEEDLPFGTEDNFVIKPKKQPTGEAKAAKLRGREITTAVKSIKGIFGIHGRDVTAEMKSEVRKALEKIQNGEGITEEDVDGLYKTYAENSEIKLGADNGILEAKAWVKGRTVYASTEVVKEFGDDWKWFRTVMNRMGVKLTTDPNGATPVDTMYQELNEVLPGYFPEASDQRAQLENIKAVLDTPSKVFVGFKEYFEDSTEESFEVWAKEQIRETLEVMATGESYIERYEESRKLDTQRRVSEMDGNVTEDQVVEAYRNINRLEHERNRFYNKSTLTDKDKNIVKMVAEGKMDEWTLSQVREANHDQLFELLKIEKALIPYEKTVSAWRETIYAAQDAKSLELIRNADSWKDPAGIVLSLKTPERALRKVAGEKDGKVLIDKLIKPVHEAIAEKNRLLKESKARIIVATSTETDKKGRPKQRRYNKAERAMAQLMLENAGYFANGSSNAVSDKAQQQRLLDMDKLIKEHGSEIDYEACAKLAVALENEYRIMYEAYNRAMIREGQKPMGYIEWYAPHFTAEPDPTTFWGKVSEYLGIRHTEGLSGGIAGQTAGRKPNKKYNAHAKERTGDSTSYDALLGFDQYADTTFENITTVRAIRQLRSVEKMLRTVYSEEGISEKAQEIIANSNLSEEAKDIELSKLWETANIYRQSHLITWLQNYTNTLAGKKSFGDREIEEQMGREVYEISKAIESRIAANMVGGNISTALTNVIPLAQMMSTTNPKYWVKALINSSTSYGLGDFSPENSDFLTNRRGYDPMMKGNYSHYENENVREFMDYLSDKTSAPMNFIDKHISEAIVRSFYEEGKGQGLNSEEAMTYADEKAAALMGDRSKGALPSVFEIKNPIAKTFTMFQVENWNQYEWLFNDVLKKGGKEVIPNVVRMTSFLVSMNILNRLFDELLGRDNVVADPLNMGYEIHKGIRGGNDPWNTVKTVFTDAVEQAPFIGGVLGGGRIPISSALPDVDAFIEGLDNKENIFLNAAENIFDPLAYVLFPVGYSQARKTVKGVGSLINGEMTGIADGEEYVKFIQNTDPWNAAKALINGPYATEAGKEYIDSGFKRLSAEETTKMRAAETYGISNEGFYETVQGLKSYDNNAQKKMALYSDGDLTGYEKATLDYIIFGDEENYRRGGNSTQSNDFTKEEIVAIGEALEGKKSTEAKREAIMELKGFSPEEKAYIEEMYGSKEPADYSDEESFRRSGLSDRLLRLEDSGLTPEQAETVDSIITEKGGSLEKTAAIAEELGVSGYEAMKIYDIGANDAWYDDTADFNEEQQKRFDLVTGKYPDMTEEEYFAVMNYGEMEGDKDEKGYPIEGSSKKNSVEAIAAVLGCSEERAEELYKTVKQDIYSAEELNKTQAERLKTVTEKNPDMTEEIYFAVLNNNDAESDVDKYGNSIEGTAEEKNIKALAEELDCNYEQAKLYYYQVEKFGYSREDLSGTLQEMKYEKALLDGWSTEKYFAAKNALTLAGMSNGKKAEKLAALKEAGFSSADANYYYELQGKSKKEFKDWEGLPEGFEETKSEEVYSLGTEQVGGSSADVTETKKKDDPVKVKSSSSSGRKKSGSAFNSIFGGLFGSGKGSNGPDWMSDAVPLSSGMSRLDYALGSILSGGGLSTGKPSTDYFSGNLSTDEKNWQNAASAYGWNAEDFAKALSTARANGYRNGNKQQIIKALTGAGFSYERARGFYNIMHNNPYYSA